MKKFKIIDMWVSITLIAYLVVINCIDLSLGTFQKKDIGKSYCVVGAWQLISMLIHCVNGWFTNKGGRRHTYHLIVIVAIIGSIFSFLLYYIPSFWVLLVTRPATQILISPLFMLFITAPFLEIYYTYLCYRETYIKMKRPLDQLK